MTIVLGWWLVPLFISIASMWWCSKQDYGGQYNFTGLITVPVTGFVICAVWMVYFAIGWALA